MKKKPGPKKRETKRIHVLVPIKMYDDIERFCETHYINKTSLSILAIQKYMTDMDRKINEEKQ